MARIFRCGFKYASIETGKYLACVTVEGKVKVVHARECKTVSDCLTKLEQIYNGKWKWIA